MSTVEHINKESVDELIQIIKGLYLEDEIPWVVGYSGGKDSTTSLQLVWMAIKQLFEEKPELRQRIKPIHVISTDTLVESPVVASWVNLSLSRMREQAKTQNLPIHVHRLTPRLNDTFWVNLIGKGYPFPRPTFRWCTSRLKIEPSNRFIREVVANHGEAIVILGTRKAESASRARIMNRYQSQRLRDNLSPNASLPNSLVFSPIEDWSNDDVWLFLNQYKNPWGHSNKDLLNIYRGASAGNECPIVLDTDTPSCGKSRFGCWVCTLVEKDKSMAAMIQNDHEKIWMSPLLELRDEIGDTEQDRGRRDFRKMDSHLLIHNGRLVHGPYTKYWREHWLRRLLEVEKLINEIGPEEFRTFKLITDEELREIRRIWLLEKHEFDDVLPRIYLEITGQQFPYDDSFSNGPFGVDEWNLLKDLCGKDELLFELQTALIDIEQRTMMLTLRRGILDVLENQIRRCYFTGEDDALSYKLQRNKKAAEIQDQIDNLLEFTGGAQ
jgi:DNA sulfur modification protein DndC